MLATYFGFGLPGFVLSWGLLGILPREFELQYSLRKSLMLGHRPASVMGKSIAFCYWLPPIETFCLLLGPHTPTFYFLVTLGLQMKFDRTSAKPFAQMKSFEIKWLAERIWPQVSEYFDGDYCAFCHSRGIVDWHSKFCLFFAA